MTPTEHVYIATHDWKDDGLDTHKGEHWYRCAKCGAQDWIASYGTKDQLMRTECHPKPAPRAEPIPESAQDEALGIHASRE